jgi:hypothetical protein
VNWDAIGAVGEIFGAVAVLLTLIYLAAQIRQNTSSVQAAAVDAAIGKVNGVREALFSNAELTKIYVQGSKDPESLDEESFVRYRLLLHNIVLAESNVYAQSALAGLSRDNWQKELSILMRVLSSKGGAWFWDNHKQEFEESFRGEVEVVLAQRDT